MPKTKKRFSDKAPAKPIRRQFADLATYSSTDRTAISVRDGVLEYLGIEIDPDGSDGLIPDRVYTVYRSPATIANAAYRMVGIPLTDSHVDIDLPPPDTGSTVGSTEVIDMVDESTQARVAVRNNLSVTDQMSATLVDKRELSLGYTGDLIKHPRWDFEQVDIQPHHLAAVNAGRCGPLCSFLDRKPQLQPTPQEGNTMSKLHKAFLDAEGTMSLEQVVEIAMELPEAIKKVPVDQLTKLMPAMQDIMSYSKEQGALPAEEGEGEGEGTTDEDPKDPPAEEDTDMADEDKPKFSDADFRDKLEKEKTKFADQAVKQFAEVVNKARNFLDSDYEFVGKTDNQVMRDALATQSTDKFEDSELPVAFKLLRKSGTDYTKFGDSQNVGGLSARLQKELEG